MAGTFGERVREGVRLNFDAEHYFGTLYANQPAGTVIAVGGLTKPHFVKTPADALAWTVGEQDVYARITLLAGKPARGRGTAVDSAYLPGVWVEVDVNGGPTAAGGVVDDGAADRDAAIELCHSVLQPTLTVASGYGVHAYWLFAEPWDIRESDDRERAGRLVEGWLRRMRQEAQAAGIAALDSVHDLARVFRPAGSFNGKGDKPVPVVLLDDGGPRYSPDAIAAETLAPVVPIIAPEPGQGREPEEITRKYPVVARLVAHEGKPPGDGSDSDWDYALVCEARRRVKPVLGREEAIALVARARGNTGKGARADYLERTVDKAFEAVAAPVPEVAPTDPAALISREWKIADDPVVAGWSTGAGVDAIVFLRRESGAVIRLRRLGDLFTATKHVTQVSVALRRPIPDLAKPKAVRIAQALIELCDVRDDHEVDRAEVQDWLGYFVAGLGAFVHGDLLGVGQPRWNVLAEQAAYKPDPDVHGIAASTAGVRDLEGRLWIPADAFMRHVRGVERASIDWPMLHSRLDDLGWERLKVDVHEPHSGKSKAGLRHIRRTFYGEPAE